MSAPGERPAEAPHPRQTVTLYGHDQAEQALLAAYRGGRIPHAWLIGGPSGIGKATLAYRMARFVLAHPDPAAVQSARSLAVEAEHKVARRIAAEAQGDLLVLERTENEQGNMRTVIAVDQVRRTVGFFGSTAGEGGWRVCVVDSADELKYPEASNALLKVLEEPPPRCLFLIVSHAPGRLLPTIRSRCRTLLLRPLAEGDVAQAAAAALGIDPGDPVLAEAAAAADGSAARAIALYGGPLLAVRERVLALLDKLPARDPRALHLLGETLERADRDAFVTFVETVRAWLSRRLSAGADKQRMAAAAEVWDKLDRGAREVEVYNLDRKPFVFTVFGWLAEAARG
jgi:DNA polymerase-3 subunit delta'